MLKNELANYIFNIQLKNAFQLRLYIYYLSLFFVQLYLHVFTYRYVEKVFNRWKIFTALIIIV